MNVKSIFIVLLALASFAPTAHAQEAMIGEIRLFGGYGGDGRTTFALPKIEGPLAQPTTVYTPITATTSTPPGDRIISVEFVNKTEEVVTIYSIGRAGNENSEGTILPGATMKVESRVNQLWRFKHEDTLVAAYVVEMGTTSYDVKFASVRTIPGSAYPRYIICLEGIYPSRN